MIETRLIQQTRQPVSIAEYASELAKNGTRVLPGSGGTYWVGYEAGVMVRIPESQLAEPTPEEIRQVLWSGRAAVVTHLLNPDEQHPANCWLYVCNDQSYGADKLSEPVRRNIRRAQRTLRIAFMDWPTLLDHGFAAFSQTRARVGLSDGTEQHFYSRFGQFSRNPAHHVVGAWQEDRLAAFMTIITMGDIVEIEGCFSTDAHRALRPNNGLVHFVLEYFLVQCGFRIVDYGVSSVQEESSGTGLHTYKKRVGFEARPVQRSFIVHPLLRPFANRFTRYGVNLALRFKPGDPLLRKAGGLLASMLGESRMMEHDIRS